MTRISHGQQFGWRSRPLFAALGLRPITSEHTRAEGALLQKCARDRRLIVEIGVSEGASATEMRQVMHPDGELYLIDPYSPARAGRPRFVRRAAHRAVASVGRGEAIWIEDFSTHAVLRWRKEIEFLFIDGDHSVDGVRADWDSWTEWIVEDGLVALHDSRTEAPWITEDDGPVQLIRSLADNPQWQIVDEVDSTTVLRRVA